MWTRQGSFLPCCPCLGNRGSILARLHGEYRASVVLALNYDSGFTVGEPSQKDLRLLYPHVKCTAPKVEVSLREKQHSLQLSFKASGSMFCLSWEVENLETRKELERSQPGSEQFWNTEGNTLLKEPTFGWIRDLDDFWIKNNLDDFWIKNNAESI